MKQVRNPYGRLAMWIALALFFVYSIMPFFWTALQSLKTIRQAFARNPLFFFEPTFKNYSDLWLESSSQNLSLLGIIVLGVVVTILLLAIFSDRISIPRWLNNTVIMLLIFFLIWIVPRIVDTAEFYNYFVNSVIVTTGVIIISMSFSSLAGYALARFSKIDGVIILIAALAFRALPRMAYALPYYSLGQLTGFHDTYVMVILVLVAANQPFSVWMLRAFFAEIPKELDEQAKIDGLGPLAAFWRIILPSAWPGIISTALFTLLLAYNEFLIVRVLTQKKWTLPVAIAQFTGGEAPGHLTLAAAAAVSATVPIIIIIMMFQKHLVKGLTGGAVKG